ncbi:MAG: 3-phenylpropionate/trans-cinnamate dioxygenase ferredoxin reductase component [Solirubrobacteraceae bacterium]|jgi:3-phenylpropionate/trans-cinnamate dioxygenase ferredoxin reductase subunit|nr:3-phenylpropionate/trans-cinnamate dioxygenase ferredoxin reductase component [Solirubrobacteraceae bacterium]
MADRSVDFLLVGGGLASANCARWLRRSGAEGSVLLVGREADLPYERPPLSKEYLRGEQDRSAALAQPPEFYADNDIEVLTRTSAMKLDLGRRLVSLSDKQEIGFDRLLLATGANVRRLNVPGAELEGIHYLRTFANSDAIRTDAAGKRVVLVGGSYIAAEVAASLTELGSQCSLIMLEPVVLSRTFGEPAARFFHDLLVDHGIEVHSEESLARFEGADGRVTRVITESGHELEADAVIIGAGVMPDVMLARAGGLARGESGGIRVDARLETETPGVFAAGDVAEYESVIHGGRRIRVEHWDVAFNQGKTAALNMLGREQDYDVVPYFFSDLSDWASIEYVGPAQSWDREVIRGSVDEGKFSVFYLEGGRVVAALSVGRSNDLQAARRLIVSGQDISGREDELAELSTDLEEL